MASRAVALVRRERPRDDLGVGLVTRRARQIGAMITGVIRRTVHEGRRRPEIRRVAIVAFTRRHEVLRALAGCLDAIVATATTAEHVGVIDHYDRLERDRRMARIADVVRGRMRHCLANCVGVVVAVNAGSWRDSDVIEHRRPPAVDGMAVVAEIVGGHMRRRFACHIDIVVAADA